MTTYIVVGPEYGRIIPVLDDGSGPLEYERDVVTVCAQTAREAKVLGVQLLRKQYYLQHYTDENPFKGVKVSKSWTQTTETECEVWVDDQLWLVEGELSQIIDHDPAYGADADGNRGIPMTYESERQFKVVRAQVDDGPWLTGLQIPHKVEQMARKWAETYQPEPEEEPDAEFYRA
jgi:hypothetical protein